jgi:outer membrane protein assembly factor BamB
MPNQQPDSPADEITVPTDMARTTTRFLHANFVQIRLAFLVCPLTLLLSFVLSQAYQRYVQLTESRHVFHSTTGESFAVIASDQQRTLASFVVPNRSGVALPEEPFEVSVEASLRLGYRKWIYPSRWNYQSQNVPYEHDLSPPASSAWSIDNVIWHESISSDTVGSEKYLALRPQGLSLINVDNGAIDWTFVDPDKIQWGNCNRGEASTFQPDRFTIREINDNGTVRKTLILAHPTSPKLLCLDAESGKKQWEVDLVQACGIVTKDPDKLCPVTLNCVRIGNQLQLQVTVVHQNREWNDTNRWLLALDAATGTYQWQATGFQSVPNITVNRPPSRLSWLDERPRESEYMGNAIAWKSSLSTRMASTAVMSKGTDRPFLFEQGDSKEIHWIDQTFWQVLDATDGKQLRSREMTTASVVRPTLVRSKGATLIMTVHQLDRHLCEYTAWDPIEWKEVWSKKIKCYLDMAMTSTDSASHGELLVTDLDGDGSDDWITSEYNYEIDRDLNSIPYSSVMAYRTHDGAALWDKPLLLPNSGRNVVHVKSIPDVDGDAIPDIVIGTRFYAGNRGETMKCYVDCISGKRGERLWQREVRTASAWNSKYATQLVHVTPIPHQRLIAVETRSPSEARGRFTEFPSSTTFLEMASGNEVASGPGVDSSSFHQTGWVESRVPQRAIHGWRYPLSCLWRAGGTSYFATDLDHDGVEEMVVTTDGNVQWLVDGRSGRPLWKIQQTPGVLLDWWSSSRDLDLDGYDEMIAMEYEYWERSSQASTPSSTHATIQWRSGRTGKRIDAYIEPKVGGLQVIAHVANRDGLNQWIVFQREVDETTVCFDLVQKKVIWSNKEFPGDPVYHFGKETNSFQSNNRNLWVSKWKESSGHKLKVTDIETSEVVVNLSLSNEDAPSCFPCSLESVQLGEREYLALQSFTKTRNSSSADETLSTYRNDVWLIEKDTADVLHWSESFNGPSKFRTDGEFDRTIQKVHLKKGSTELAAIVWNGKGMDLQLLDIERIAEVGESKSMDKLVAKKRLPLVDCCDALQETWLWDYDQDGVTDFGYADASGIHCKTLLGNECWSKHRPSIAPYAIPKVQNGKAYLLLHDFGAEGRALTLLNGLTGDAVSDPVDLLRSKSPGGLDFIALHEYFEERFGNWDEFCSVAPAALHPPKIESEDPRLKSDLPWIKMAHSMIWQEYTSFSQYPLHRFARLAIFLFVLPAVGLWSLFRRRFSLRALIATGFAVALACMVYVHDQRAYPGANPYESNVIVSASSLVLYLFFFCVPLYMMIRGKWRRKVAIGVFAIVAVALALLDTFVDAPRQYELPVAYRWLDWGHLSYLCFALIPSGVLLFIVLFVGWLFRLMTGRSRPTISG